MIRVLFVDDEDNILQGLKRTFRDMRSEWDMAFAKGGEEALGLIEKTPFDVVVSDMRMPGMDGGKLLAAVQRRLPDALRLVLSGHTDRDMILRTVKPAHQFLAKPIEPEELKRCIRRSTLLRDTFLDEAVRSVITRIEALPSVPKTYGLILEELAKEEASLKTIAELIAEDVGMCANVLKLVNSAFFGLRTHVASPAHAVNLLGTDVIKSLILHQQAFSMFKRERFPKYNLELLWSHSLTTGLFAKCIAHSQGSQAQVVDDCYIAGLLHDVGKLVLASNFEDQYHQVLSICHEHNRTVWQAEHEVFGTSHAEVGAYLLGLWGLPEVILEAVYHHHDPRGRKSTCFAPLTAVHVANYLQHETTIINPDYTRNRLETDYLAEAGCLDKMDAWREACATTASQDRDGPEAAC